MRQDDCHLLASVARRDVGVARGLAQRPSNMLEHHIALRVAVSVVDRLEIVEVEHDQTDGVPVAANLLDFSLQQLLEAAMVRQTGQLVGHRLLPNLVVQLDVVERQRGLGGKGSQNVAITVVELAFRAPHRDQPAHSSAGLERPERDRRNEHALRIRLAEPAVAQRPRLCFVAVSFQPAQRPDKADLSERLLGCVAHAKAGAGRLNGVDRGLQRELEQRRSVQV